MVSLPDTSWRLWRCGRYILSVVWVMRSSYSSSFTLIKPWRICPFQIRHVLKNEEYDVLAVVEDIPERGGLFVWRLASVYGDDASPKENLHLGFSKVTCKQPVERLVQSLVGEWPKDLFELGDEPLSFGVHPRQRVLLNESPSWAIMRCKLRSITSSSGGSSAIAKESKNQERWRRNLIPL